MPSKHPKVVVPMTIEWSQKRNRRHFLKHLIDINNFKNIVEVGVRDGRTTFHLLDHCPSIEKYYAIDRNIGLFYDEGIKKMYKEKLIPIQGNSQEVHKQVPDNACDLVFIDADHSYPAVKQDIINYKPKLKANGILSGHDIDFLGVNQAVNEMLEKYDVGPNNVWFVQ